MVWSQRMAQRSVLWSVLHPSSILYQINILFPSTRRQVKWDGKLRLNISAHNPNLSPALLYMLHPNCSQTVDCGHGIRSCHNSVILGGGSNDQWLLTYLDDRESCVVIINIFPLRAVAVSSYVVWDEYVHILPNTTVLNVRGAVHCLLLGRTI